LFAAYSWAVRCTTRASSSSLSLRISRSSAFRSETSRNATTPPCHAVRPLQRIGAGLNPDSSLEFRITPIHLDRARLAPNVAQPRILFTGEKALRYLAGTLHSGRSTARVERLPRPIQRSCGQQDSTEGIFPSRRRPPVPPQMLSRTDWSISVWISRACWVSSNLAVCYDRSSACLARTVSPRLCSVTSRKTATPPHSCPQGPSSGELPPRGQPCSSAPAAPRSSSVEWSAAQRPNQR
jgi:hypothetical protein